MFSRIVGRLPSNPGYPESALSRRNALPRPVKWSRDVHAIRERAGRSRTETWARTDLEHLFGVGRASAQTLMKAIGQVQAVAGNHFVDRSSLLRFLDEMAQTPSIEDALRGRLKAAAPVPRPAPLRVSLPGDLRSATLDDLPENVQLSPGRIEITAPSAAAMAEALVLLATVMQNDLDRWQLAVEPPPPPPAREDPGGLSEELKGFLEELRARRNLSVASS